MKKKIITTAIAMAFISTSVHASEIENWQKGGIITGGAVIGAVAGGPIGFLIGAGLGIWINDGREQASESERLSVALSRKQAKMVKLEQDLAFERIQTNVLNGDYDELTMELNNLEDRFSEYQQLATQRLQFDLKFRTDQSQLDEVNQNKVHELAQFIKAHPQIMVSLEGYADPRGSGEYNQKLSNYRIQSVMNSLLEFGIDPERIQLAAFGSSQSQVEPGDYDGYAFERRVAIELFEQNLASID